MEAGNTTLYEWEFNSKKTRGPLWYTITLACIIGLVIWGFLTQQYAMSFVILLMSGLFYYIENNSNDTVQVRVQTLGIGIEDRFYDYGNIHSYTLIYADKTAVYLRLNLLKKSIASLDLHIDNEVAEQLSLILPEYIEENAKKDLSLLEKITHWFKL